MRGELTLTTVKMGAMMGGSKWIGPFAHRHIALSVGFCREADVWCVVAVGLIIGFIFGMAT